MFRLITGLAVVLSVACGSAPPSEPPPTSTPPPPVDDGPCEAIGPGLTAEETGAFVAGDAPDGVVVLMGGAAEVDRASARFVDGASGGDVLVLRASGSTSSYTSYFSEELAGLITTPARATATVRVDDAAAGDDAGLLCRLRRADAVWLAGGDQSDYLLQWPEALHAGLRDAVARGAAIGGTSAGAMSWSAVSFDARDGGVTSSEALSDPSSPVISTSASPFGAVPGVIVDTHFQARDREGRLLVFAAREGARGVGIDEGTALVIDGDAASVVSDDDGSVWVYEVGGAVVEAGRPFSADVKRARLADGATLSWPMPAVVGDSFTVDDGVIVD